MRTFQARHIFAACIAAYAISIPASAQQAAPDVPPPQLEPLEEVTPQPATTIPERSQEQHINENRTRSGQVTDIQVTNGNSTYYLKPKDPGSEEDNYARSAQWEIFRFDLRTNKEKAEAAAEAAATPPPPGIDSPSTR